MSATVTISLRNATNWNPTEVLSQAAIDSSVIENSLPLGDCVNKLLPSFWDQMMVVRPSDVAEGTGWISLTNAHRADLVFRMHALNGLQPGDLLLSAGRPVVMVTSAFEALPFSSAFLALRPRDHCSAEWLWAFLNSGTGETLRARYLDRSVSRGLGSLSWVDLPIPREPLLWDRERSLIRELAQSFGVTTVAQDAGQSWWRLARLPENGEPWNVILAARDPETLTQGVALSTLAREIVAGRKVDSTAAADAHVLPLYGGYELRGNDRGLFATTNGVVGEVGDVVVQRVGERGRAAVLAVRCVIDASVYLIRLADPASAISIVAFLNSGPGQRQRKYRVSGAFIPALPLAGLRELRVIAGDFSSEFAPTLPPLSQRIHELVGL